ncbi:hypothetical protein [Bacteroides caccae]|uniref:hypothetical protein n=1 Tax=Bacteroides caccae TaxID=47678 RepID=UPI0008A1B2AF|nr:hypothetical protein [Bacteroides caccae]KAA5463449.1 hypothetical protein F2Y37_19745 [Bacteroides caccae]OFL01473.1 hypothetical protein HMPREF2794_07385 [Bacteroides sp. HMSC067B03]
MESYTYLFLFVLQLVFTVVVLLALLHEKRLQKQLEKKNKQLLTELSNLREEIQAMTNTHFTFTGRIARISESTMTALAELKKLISATEKLKKELERIKAAPSRNIKKLPVSRKQPLPVNPTLGSKARKKKRLQTGVAYGRS